MFNCFSGERDNFMKKSFGLVLFATLLTINGVWAQEENLLISEEVLLEDNVDKAQEQAKRLLDAKPRQPQGLKAPELRRATGLRKKTQNGQLSPAPFGLNWGASVSEVENLGVTLKKIYEKDYVNNFQAGHLPKPVKDFRDVKLTFGENNRLWRILAYGDYLDDDTEASKVLRQYRIYYDLLKAKYGNAQEFFTPETVTVEKVNDRGQKENEQQTQPMGAPGFLEALQSGRAELYATFENKEVGVALAVNVDGSGKSYIVIDYKNLRILKAEEGNVLDAL